jgi:Cdc6-like AAA superfamily ATPase
MKKGALHKMEWIVLGYKKGAYQLISKTPKKDERAGLLPKGSYLTVEIDDERKVILRVDDSAQHEPYSPSPMIIDMDLSPMYQDQKAVNTVSAYPVKHLKIRRDGLVDPIPSQKKARRSTQEEVDAAMEVKEEGPIIFPATIHDSQNQLLLDDKLNIITTRLPTEMFFHQIQICGKTGSGKTVASKYLAQHFVEEMEGAVLAINVKDVDFLRMEQASVVTSESVKEEWSQLKESARGIESCRIYYPATINLSSIKSGVNIDICEKITLGVKEIEPESLAGLLQNISGPGAQQLPDIFRHWKNTIKENDTFDDFVAYFAAGQDNPRFPTENVRERVDEILMHKGTFNNVLRNLHSACEFFDNEDATKLDHDDILVPGKLSVINVAGNKGIQFGSILLRHLLKRIVEVKSLLKSTVPILVIIDEVHQFYNTDSSKEALAELDTICRTGRSQNIGVIFSSQNQDDLPKGLSSVINTKIFFRSDNISSRLFNVPNNEIQTLRKGYAVCNIHDVPQLKIIKFPLSFSGVFEQ